MKIFLPSLPSKIRPGMSIVIYGAGQVGRAYYEQSLGIRVIQWCDNNYAKYKLQGFNVEKPSVDWKHEEFDYVVIASSNSSVANEIKKIIMNGGVDEKKILWEDPWIDYFEKESKYSLSVCSMLKGEKNIKEWIECHRIVGVEHFYIYDNSDEFELKAQLNSYVDDGVVTLMKSIKL